MYLKIDSSICSSISGQKGSSIYQGLAAPSLRRPDPYSSRSPFPTRYPDPISATSSLTVFALRSQPSSLELLWIRSPICQAF